MAKINHHIAAKDHVEFVERGIRDEVVRAEDDVVTEMPPEDNPFTICGEVIRERQLAARELIVAGIFLHGGKGKYAGACALEHAIAQVSGVNAATVRDAPSS